MKKTFTILTILAALVTIVLTSSFESIDNSEKEKGKLPLDIIKANFHADLDTFQMAIETLLASAKKINNNAASITQLQTDFKNARLAYKEVEYLLAYLDEEAMVYHINGAPLPKLEKHVPEIRIFEPSGLQAIDEIVFSDDPLAEKKHLVSLTEKMLKEYKGLKNIHKRDYFSDRQVFEAVRLQLVRILSLGITGFDTPGSLHALPEAKSSLHSLSQSMNLYLSYLNKKDPALSKKIVATFKEAIEYLQNNNDFDGFDRLTFTRDYIDPLFNMVLKVQLTLGVETFYEVSNIKSAINYEAEHIFATDFLDPLYYIRISKEQDTDELAELGQMLFFDPILSKNNQRACASCHNPKRAFTDGRDKSLAFDFKGKINRNAPTVINSIYNDEFFYDLRVDQFDLQVDHVVFAEDEFNTDYEEIVKKLKQSEEYTARFHKVFGEQEGVYEVINSGSINSAIVAYVKRLASYNSELDQYIRGEVATYPEAAHRGFNLFMGKALCGTCHFAPTFSGLVPPGFTENEAEVIGVPATNDTLNPTIDPDLGKYGSGNMKGIADFHKFAFKTTTVRNAALTAPYMHNGVYNSLEEVVDFYNRGGGAGMGIDLPNQTLPFDNLNLTKQEQADLVAFMETLTDTTGITTIPAELPKFPDHLKLDDRPIGGKY